MLEGRSWLGTSGSVLSACFMLDTARGWDIAGEQRPSPSTDESQSPKGSSPERSQQGVNNITQALRGARKETQTGLNMKRTVSGWGWLVLVPPCEERNEGLLLLSHVRLFAIPWAAAHEAPLSMGFSRQAYRSGLPFPPPGDLPDPGINPCLLHWQTRFFPIEPLGKPSQSANPQANWVTGQLYLQNRWWLDLARGLLSPILE